MDYKVFQIGFNRSGTTSFHHLFKGSGYKSIHYCRGLLAMKVKSNVLRKANNTAYAKRIKLLDGLDDFDFYSDMEYVYSELKNNKNPFYAYTYFRELYYDYPDAKFIFNFRPDEDWVKSRINYSERYAKEFKELTGIKHDEDMIELWKQHYYDHIDNVLEFFKDKPNKLLIFDLSKDEPSKIINFFSDLKLDITKWAKHNTSKNGNTHKPTTKRSKG